MEFFRWFCVTLSQQSQWLKLKTSCNGCQKRTKQTKVWTSSINQTPGIDCNVLWKFQRLLTQAHARKQFSDFKSKYLRYCSVLRKAFGNVFTRELFWSDTPATVHLVVDLLQRLISWHIPRVDMVISSKTCIFSGKIFRSLGASVLVDQLRN